MTRPEQLTLFDMPREVVVDLLTYGNEVLEIGRRYGPYLILRPLPYGGYRATRPE